MGLRPEVSRRSGEGPGVSLGGRALDIDPAVPQDDARAMASKQANSGPKDRRNLYLVSQLCAHHISQLSTAACVSIVRNVHRA